MSRSIVSLQPSGAFIEFSVQLGASYRFEFDWNTTHQYFLVTIKSSTGVRLVAGRGLHIGVNIMEGIDGFTGTLKTEGVAPTPYNLGITCKLVWER